MGLATTALYPPAKAAPYERLTPTHEITWGQLQVPQVSWWNGAGARAGAARIGRPSRGASNPTCRQPRPWGPSCLKPCAQGQLVRTSTPWLIHLSRLGTKGCQRSSRKAAGAAAATSLNGLPVSAPSCRCATGVLGDTLEKLREFRPASQRLRARIRSRPCVSPHR